MKTRKKREKTGGKWARYGLKRVKESVTSLPRADRHLITPDPTWAGVPVSAWFVASEVPRMAEAVQQYASEGHVWMKYHVSPFHNVLEQTAAMQVRFWTEILDDFRRFVDEIWRF